MPGSSVGPHVLAKAVKKLGEAEVASRLQISVRSLQALIAGFTRIPDAIFFSAVDMVMAEPPDAPSESPQDKT